MNEYTKSVLTAKLEAEQHKAESIAQDVKTIYNSLIRDMRYLGEYYDNVLALCNSLEISFDDFDVGIRELLGEEAYYMFTIGKYNKGKAEWTITTE